MNKKNFNITRAALFLSILLPIGGTFAAVPAEEAAKLGTTLTPLGAERAGNKDGSIPAWDGGLIDASTVDGGKRGDPYASEKPLFTITAATMAQYADKLSPGTQALLKKYPDSYQMLVYQTHRSAAAPQSVYDATRANAAAVKLVSGTSAERPDGGAGGIPFPIPRFGAEAIWNHLLRWRGVSWHSGIRQYLITSEGKLNMTSEARVDAQLPWYMPGMFDEKSGVFWFARLRTEGPPLRAGEAILGAENIDGEKTTSWTYLPGQRRIRRLPNACCDTPTPATAGVMSFDEVSVFTGRIDRFDWKLLGKKEMFIPYNSNKVMTAASPAELLGPKHMNPDKVRWELHRVWVVEATLKPGVRHVMPKSTYYLDEDTWSAVLGERYDVKGQMAKVLYSIPVVMPDLPGTVTTTAGFYDLVTGTWFASDVFAGSADQYRIVPPFKASEFTPDALVGSGLR
jgi:hypothetical protein